MRSNPSEIMISRTLLLALSSISFVLANPLRVQKNSNQSEAAVNVKLETASITDGDVSTILDEELFKRINEILTEFERKSQGLLGSLRNDDVDTTNTVNQLIDLIIGALKSSSKESETNFKKAIGILSKSIKGKSGVAKNKVDIDATVEDLNLRSLSELNEKWLKLKAKVTELIKKAEEKFEQVKKKGSKTLQKTLEKWQRIKEKSLKLVDEAGKAFNEIKAIVSQTYKEIKELFKKEQVEFKADIQQ